MPTPENVGGASGNNNTTGNISFTVTSATKLYVGISIGWGNADPISAVSSGFPKWNGTSLTQISGSKATDGAFEGVAWYELAAPAAGTFNVTCDFNTTVQYGVHIIGVLGAGITTRTPSTNTGTSTNPSVTVADTANADLVISLCANDNQTGNSANATGTTIQDHEDVSSDSDFTSQYQTASGANTVCSWTQSGSGSGWATSGFAVRDPATTPVLDPWQKHGAMGALMAA